MGFLKDKPQAQPMSYDMGGMMNDAGVSDGSGNFIAQMADTAPENNAPMTVPAGPTAKRVSALDIIGAVLDSGAEFGGASAGYQPMVDRRRLLAQEAEDRAVQKQFNEQKLTAGQLGIDGTKEEMGNARADRQLTRFGQASRGLGAVFAKHGAPGVQKAFPLLAKSMGMNPQETEIFGAALAADPEGTIQTVTAATTADSSGSQPKEKIIAELLRARDPSGAMEKRYLDNIASGMTDYQSGNLALGQDKIASAERIAAIRARAAERAARIRASSAGGKGGAKGAVRIDPATLNLALGVTGELRGIYGSLRDMGATVNPDQNTLQNIGARVRSSGFGQLVEGAIGTQAQTNRDKISGIRPNLIRRISEATGMTAAQMNSDKDMQLLLDQVTDPTMSYDANMAAIDRLEELIVSRAGEGSAPASRSPRPRIRLKPRGNAAPAAGRVFKYNPKTGNLE